MTAETENIVLESLRGMRADMNAINARLDGIDGRLDAIETQMEGWRQVFVATTGSLVTDVKDHDARITALEGARA